MDILDIYKQLIDEYKGFLGLQIACLSKVKG